MQRSSLHNYIPSSDFCANVVVDDQNETTRDQYIVIHRAGSVLCIVRVNEGKNGWLRVAYHGYGSAWCQFNDPMTYTMGKDQAQPRDGTGCSINANKHTVETRV